MTTLNEFRDRTVMVTGGCGFIGSHLVRALVDGGARKVVVIDSLRQGDRSNLAGLSTQVRVVPFTLGEGSPETLSEAMAGADYLFHLAAEKHNQSVDKPLDVISANISGTHTLLDLAARHKVRKVVFSSSLYAYGRTDPPAMIEAETPRPWTVYGISKLCGEHLLEHFRRLRGLPYVVLRYFFVYGPRQHAGTGYRSVIVKNFERILRGENPTVHGDGTQALDYVYVDDVISATILAMESDLSGEVFNVGSGRPTQVGALIDAMLKAARKDLRKEHLPPDWTAGTYRVAGIDKIRSSLHWSPQVPLEEGLSRTWAWIRQRALDEA